MKQHISYEDALALQLEVYLIAAKWIKRPGACCPICVLRHLLIAASAVAMDGHEWPAEMVHDVVDGRYGKSLLPEGFFCHEGQRVREVDAEARRSSFRLIEE